MRVCSPGASGGRVRVCDPRALVEGACMCALRKKKKGRADSVLVEGTSTGPAVAEATRSGDANGGALARTSKPGGPPDDDAVAYKQRKLSVGATEALQGEVGGRFSAKAHRPVQRLVIEFRESDVHE